MKLLDGKIVIITGAGSGIGEACVEVCVREGAKVLAADVSGAQKDVAARLGSSVLPVQCDITKEAEVEALFQLAVKEFGRLDVLLNIAGIADAGVIAEVDMDQYDNMMNVDLRGSFLATKYAFRAMEDKGGSIVLCSSIGGLNSSPFTAVYGAAKAGVVHLTKSAALEGGPNNIRVNCLCPGYIANTNMSNGAEEFMPEIVTKACLQRGGKVHEVAEVAAFLASDRASYVSGAIVPVDGGWSSKLA